jgi:hypothetical protein
VGWAGREGGWVGDREVMREAGRLGREGGRKGKAKRGGEGGEGREAGRSLGSC